MSNNKQSSSIDFFWNQLPEILPFSVDTETAVKLWEAFEQAKAMHKEEMIQSYSNGWHDGQDIIINGIAHIQVGGDAAGQQYYNSTFGGEQ